MTAPDTSNVPLWAGTAAMARAGEIDSDLFVQAALAGLKRGQELAK